MSKETEECQSPSEEVFCECHEDKQGISRQRQQGATVVVNMKENIDRGSWVSLNRQIPSARSWEGPSLASWEWPAISMSIAAESSGSEQLDAQGFHVIMDVSPFPGGGGGTAISNQDRNIIWFVAWDTFPVLCRARYWDPQNWSPCSQCA